MSTKSLEEKEISQHDAFMQLVAPDGYYKYLGVEKIPVEDKTGNSSSSSPNAPSFTVDVDLVKKSYRKLSRRHHPDKGGDPNTFRLLNRAQRVLLHPKLRAQYDNLGIDLDDDEGDHHSPSDVNNGDDTNDESSNNKDAGNGISQGIISELATIALSGMMQLIIRTALMGVAAVLVVRYRWTAIPALLFMAYIVVQVVGKASIRGGSVYDTGASLYDAISPILIFIGLFFMFLGRTRGSEEQEAKDWTWLFWLGETMVVALFSYNSLINAPWNIFSYSLLAVAAGLLALWFRGKFYNYLTALVLEVILAVLIAMAFPIMELVLEAILNEKLKKVGEKIRSHHRQLEQYYLDKYQNRKC
ncbi:hypothetical protein ACA910_008115 [Epithemia clementina (nom. ined.)]